MTKQKIFEFAIISHPSEKEAKDGKTSVMIVKPETILAADERAAMIMASRKIPTTHLEKLDRVEIALRPF